MARSVCSYNIHGSIGIDGVHDSERLRQVLRSIDADIFALQEVEVLVDAPGLLEYLCEGTDWVPVAGPTMYREHGEYGNAVLTRLPIRNQQRLDLSQAGREPRGALRLLLEYENNGKLEYIDLFATHLGLRPGERRKQIQSLLTEMENPNFDTGMDGLSMLVGDLNEWFLWGRPLRWLRRYFTTTPAPPSFPSRWPFLSLDRIWVKPRHRLCEVNVWRDKVARTASDHLPIVARVK
ncbi:MAG: endonuclease/exonuclease/phosphatase family protein [Gammaproteobacteria bacterium]|nr:endonuclease/exonuclease/phosphatase family protein [Gammaproteobacteria bacterium]